MAFFYPGKGTIKTKYLNLLLLLLLLVLTSAVYYPALDSGFFLDDYPNLSPLEQTESYGYESYILGGVSSQLGRPLSLLTFALQADAWPDNPFAFKSVNLVIHLLNGLLLYTLCRLLGSSPRSGVRPHQVCWFSLAMAALWLLHPVQITTVLYTVQRMAQLSAFFTLVGINGYFYFRSRYVNKRDNKACWWMGLSVVTAMTMAILSKENGILLPLFILIAEMTLYGFPERSEPWRRRALIMLSIPLTVLLLYLLSGLGDEIQSYGNRSYGVAERLLTQPVVLLAYLRNLLLPHPGSASLFNDDFTVSTGLLSPPVTLVALIMLIGLLTTAFLSVKRLPVIAFGIFWFFGGHLLESSYLNLELYFDHRNYLPSIGILFVFTWVIFVLARYYRNILIAGALAYYLLIGYMTFANSELWSRPLEHMLAEVREHPTSPRALTYLAGIYMNSHDLFNSKRVFQGIMDLYPDEIYPHIKLVTINTCYNREGSRAVAWNQLKNIAAGQERKNGFDVISALEDLVTLATGNYCDDIDIGQIRKLIEILLENPLYKSNKSQLHQMIARIEWHKGDINSTVNHLELSSRYSPSVPQRLSQIEFLLQIGKIMPAREFYTRLEEHLDKRPRFELAYNDALGELRHKIEENESSNHGRQ